MPWSPSYDPTMGDSRMPKKVPKASKGPPSKARPKVRKQKPRPNPGGNYSHTPSEGTN